MERAIIHFNVADFAVAVERIVDSALCKRAVIIAPLQAARAVVYDMSEEAFCCGVQKGMPLSRAARLCRRATILPPRPGIYRRAMQAFLGQVRDYSPRVEHGAVDGHIFVDVTGTHRLFGPAPDIGLKVRKRVRDGLGINPIWSLAGNKLVAKVASRLVKPAGEYIVGPGEEEDFLAPLPLPLLPGLFPEEVNRLRAFNLVKIGQLANLTREQLMVPFGRRSDFLHAASHGIDTSAITTETPRTSPLAFEHFFADDTNDKKELAGTAANLAAKAGRELRAKRQVARQVEIRLTYADGVRSSGRAASRRGSGSDFVLKQLARQALQRALTRRIRVRSCHLLCSRLQKESPQLLLFPETAGPEIRQEKTCRALDTITTRFGPDLIRAGAPRIRRQKPEDRGQKALCHVLGSCNYQ